MQGQSQPCACRRRGSIMQCLTVGAQNHHCRSRTVLPWLRHSLAAVLGPLKPPQTLGSSRLLTRKRTVAHLHRYFLWCTHVRPCQHPSLAAEPGRLTPAQHLHSSILIYKPPAARRHRHLVHMIVLSTADPNYASCHADHRHCMNFGCI